MFMILKLGGPWPPQTLTLTAGTLSLRCLPRPLLRVQVLSIPWRHLLFIPFATNLPRSSQIGSHASPFCLSFHTSQPCRLLHHCPNICAQRVSNSTHCSSAGPPSLPNQTKLPTPINIDRLPYIGYRVMTLTLQTSL